MKHIITLVFFVLLFSENIQAQEYIFRFNPYSGYNQAQLELALEQSTRMKRNGIIATGVGTGMIVGGSVMMFNSLYNLAGESFNATKFGIGIGVMCFSGFPLGYGLVAWITGSEQIKQIEIELLASDKGNLKIQPTGDGYGLVYRF
jgi:hypothetical protein